MLSIECGSRKFWAEAKESFYSGRFCDVTCFRLELLLVTISLIGHGWRNTFCKRFYSVAYRLKHDSSKVDYLSKGGLVGISNPVVEMESK